MSVRSIVTFVDPADVGQRPVALFLAMDLAKGQGAQVVVHSFPVDVLDGAAEDAQDFARTRAAISALADKAGVPVVVIDRSSFAYGIGEVFADHIKVADLGILTGHRGPLAGERLLVNAALFDTGRPLIVVPRKGQVAVPRCALIAWDGTHTAARAMQDAIAILPPGAEAIVARVTDDKDLRMGQSGIEAAHHLARHGIKAEFRNVPRNGRDIFDALTATAHETGCDLLVAGAVRHAPLHELIFGSVTGKVLAGDCDLPVLLSA